MSNKQGDTESAARADWLLAGLLALAVLLVGVVAILSGSMADLLTVAPLALIAVSLGTRRYFGVEALVRIAERLLRRRPRAPAVESPRGLDVETFLALVLLAGTRASRAPPLTALA